jgi:uncharacterized protein YfaT (DUF1175 family)
MKVWLLKNKQTKIGQLQNPPPKRYMPYSCKVLVKLKDNTIIKIGDEKILTKNGLQTKKAVETGYLKLNWKANEITKEMATKHKNKSKVPGYGGIYWQYFEDSDKIKPILIPVCLFQRVIPKEKY